MMPYLNWPWMIDEQDYNCSSHTVSEWLARGSVNEIQGAYFAVTGSAFIALYSISLVAMYRSNLLEIPCFRLMFFNGIIDILDLIDGSLLPTYFHFRGTVFCSDRTLDYLAGQLGLSNFVFLWMSLSVFYMLARMFLTRPTLFNSAAASYFFAPLISNDILWEMSYYNSPLFLLHNLSIVAILPTVYSVLCVYVLKEKLRFEKVQLTIFLQVFCICASTTTAALLYVYMNFVESPRYLAIAGNVVWQMSHGIHGLVYISLNRQIRREVQALICCRKSSSIIRLSSLKQSSNHETNNPPDRRQQPAQQCAGII